MKIITLNCFLSPWSPERKNRLPHLTEAILAEKPDIVILQEVFFKSDAQYLIRNLKGHGFVDSFYSNTLLIISRYPFTSRTHNNFKQRVEFNILLYLNEVLNWLYGKGYQVVEVSLEDKPIFIANTHLLSAYGLDYGSFRKARLRQFLEIEDHFKQIGAKQIILGGDFNFDTHSPSYETVIKHYGFYDPLRDVKGNTISTDNLNRRFFLMAKMNQRLDHFFTKGLEQAKASGRVIFHEPYFAGEKKLHISDHYGLSLNLNV